MTHQTNLDVARRSVAESRVFKAFCIPSGLKQLRLVFYHCRAVTFLVIAFVLTTAGAVLPVQDDRSAGTTDLTTPAVSCNLPAPGFLNAQRTSATSAFLEWGSVSGAECYRVKIYQADTHALISNTVETANSAYVSVLESGVSYYCSVAPMCTWSSTSDFVIIEEILD